jgi:hypothetical protein
MEKFGDFKFVICKNIDFKGFFYKIMDENEIIIRHSNESFINEGIASLAAIGHISLLEQKKG